MVCSRPGCYSISASHEFGGLCGKCFSGLSEKRRRIILHPTALDEPGPTIHKHEHVEINHPPQSRVVTFLVGLAGAALWTLLNRWMGW